MAHDCDAILVTCIDFRLQKFIEDWARKNLHPEGKYDRVAIAGGVQNIPFVRDQVNISIRLHHIHKVVLVNHEECGAYPEGTTRQQHVQDLVNMAARIMEAHRDLTFDFEMYYLHLDGTFDLVQAYHNMRDGQEVGSTH